MALITAKVQCAKSQDSFVSVSARGRLLCVSHVVDVIRQLLECKAVTSTLPNSHNLFSHCSVHLSILDEELSAFHDKLVKLIWLL